jgi:hypothetical protein
VKKQPVLNLALDMLGTKQRISRKQTALQQIEAAIGLFRTAEYACAITLSLAAEDQIPDTDAPHVFKLLKERAPALCKEFNRVRNWLKHYDPKEPEEMDIFEFEVVLAIVRATTKFVAAYQEISADIEAFDNWSKERLGLSIRGNHAAGIRP